MELSYGGSKYKMRLGLLKDIDTSHDKVVSEEFCHQVEAIA